MNAHRTIPTRFSRDMLMAKAILIACESLRRLAGSSGPEPFNRCEDALRHARVITIPEPEADGKLTTVAVRRCWHISLAVRVAKLFALRGCAAVVGWRSGGFRQPIADGVVRA